MGFKVNATVHLTVCAFAQKLFYQVFFVQCRGVFLGEVGVGFLIIEICEKFIVRVGVFSVCRDRWLIVVYGGSAAHFFV